MGINTHVGDGDSLSRITKILEHVLDQDGALSSGALYSESVSVLLTTACCVKVILTDRNINSIGAGEGDRAHGIDIEDGI